MKNNSSLSILSSLSGVLAAVLALAVVLLSGHFVPDYNHSTQFISELNATGTPWAEFTGFLGFIPIGLVTMYFLWRLKAELSPSKRVYVGLAFAALIGTDWLVTALAPCDMGCPVMGDISLSQKIHLFSGLLTTLLMPIGTYLLIEPLRKAGFSSLVRRLSWLVIAVCVLSQVVLIGGWAADFMGVVQRITVACYYLYLSVLSIEIYRRVVGASLNQAKTF